MSFGISAGTTGSKATRTIGGTYADLTRKSKYSEHSHTCRLTPPKLTIQPCECSPCKPAADGAQIVAFRQTEPWSPLIAKMFPALTLSTVIRSRPIIVYRASTVALTTCDLLCGSVGSTALLYFG